MTLQDKMIGKHPSDGLFFDWVECHDTECTDIKRHRYLSEKEETRQEAIETAASWLVTYHLSRSKRMGLCKKQKILNKYDFEEYAESLHVFPNTDKTKKGNLGEVILTEYLSQVSGIKVLIFKLHYNPNVDQSMKGDDVLLVDEKKIILGESKFRATPSKNAVEEASQLMNNTLALPMSLGFIADILFEQDQVELAEQILDIQYKMSKTAFDIKNIGFLLSTKLVKDHVERNMDSINKDFLFISLGIDNPVEFMELAFTRAKELLIEVSKDES
jgi:hypothetical protein